MSADPDRIQRPARPRADGLLMHERALWSYAHIALYSGYEYNYVLNDLSCRPDFPKPIRAVPGAHPRYIAGEIMAYFESHQEASNDA